MSLKYFTGNGVVKNNYSLYVRNNLVCFAVYVAMLTNSQVAHVHADINLLAQVGGETIL